MTDDALTADLVLCAPAKVNLTLEVLGRRPDGYHEICSVMQAISLADRLALTPARELQLRCSRAELEGPDNLVWRAAELLRRATHSTSGAAIFLEKRTPVAAGLGGGSSDAAAALLGLNELWRLGQPRPRLMELAAQIGSDVPFFLSESACALVEGRGERVTPLPPLPPRWLVLLTLPSGLSTGSVYQAFPRQGWGDGTRTRAWLQRALTGRDLPATFNDLEAVALQVAPEVARGRDALLAAGAPQARLSGSGPTYFALFDVEAAARQVHGRLVAGRHEAYLAAFGDRATAWPVR